MFRAECQAGTELGKLVASIMAQGGLVSDETVDAIVASRIARPDCANGFLLDGYPRTLPQAMHFSALLRGRELPGPVVIHLTVADEVLVARLTARRQCPVCHGIYNLQSQPPRKPDCCDDDGAALITRADDREDVIRHRLEAYREMTGPILKWYGPGAVRTVDGAQPADVVARAVERVVLEANPYVAVR